MEDCRIPRDNILPKASGLQSAFSCLNSARFGISWGALGAAEACYSSEGLRLGPNPVRRAVISNQLVQKKLADIVTELGLGYCAVQRLERDSKDQGRASVEALSLLKRNSCGKALDIARTCRDMLGGNGIKDGVPRHPPLHEPGGRQQAQGTHDVHALVLGRGHHGHTRRLFRGRRAHDEASMAREGGDWRAFCCLTQLM